MKPTETYSQICYAYLKHIFPSKSYKTFLISAYCCGNPFYTSLCLLLTSLPLSVTLFLRQWAEASTKLYNWKLHAHITTFARVYEGVGGKGSKVDHRNGPRVAFSVIERETWGEEEIKNKRAYCQVCGFYSTVVLPAIPPKTPPPIPPVAQSIAAHLDQSRKIQKVLIFCRHCHALFPHCLSLCLPLFLCFFSSSLLAFHCVHFSLQFVEKFFPAIRCIKYKV